MNTEQKKANKQQHYDKEQSKEAKAVCKLVTKKLEQHINVERREQRFDVGGIHRTTRRMHSYDLAYKVAEATILEKVKPKTEQNDMSKEQNGQEKQLSIKPRLNDNSKHVTLNREVQRITQNANTVYKSVPIERLYSIHSYQPHCKSTKTHNTEIKVQNYTRNPQAALHSHVYLDYYVKEGLNTGNPENGERFQKLKKKKDKEDGETKGSMSKRKTDPVGSRPVSTNRSPYSASHTKVEPRGTAKTKTSKATPGKGKNPKDVSHDPKASQKGKERLSTASSSPLCSSKVQDQNSQFIGNSQMEGSHTKENDNKSDCLQLRDDNTKESGESEPEKIEKPNSCDNVAHGKSNEVDSGELNVKSGSESKELQEDEDKALAEINGRDNNSETSAEILKENADTSSSEGDKKSSQSFPHSLEKEGDTSSSDGGSCKTTPPSESGNGDNYMYDEDNDADKISIQTYVSISHVTQSTC